VRVCSCVYMCAHVCRLHKNGVHTNFQPTQHPQPIVSSSSGRNGYHQGSSNHPEFPTPSLYEVNFPRPSGGISPHTHTGSSSHGDTNSHNHNHSHSGGSMYSGRYSGSSSSVGSHMRSMHGVTALTVQYPPAGDHTHSNKRRRGQQQQQPPALSCATEKYVTSFVASNYGSISAAIGLNMNRDSNGMSRFVRFIGPTVMVPGHSATLPIASCSSSSSSSATSSSTTAPTLATNLSSSSASSSS
jgi:hypothetical protein